MEGPACWSGYGRNEAGVGWPKLSTLSARVVELDEARIAARERKFDQYKFITGVVTSEQAGKQGEGEERCVSLEWDTMRGARGADARGKRKTNINQSFNLHR